MCCSSVRSSTPSHTQPLSPIDLVSKLTDFPSSLSYIIVQRPLNLWNGMFDRHQAKITVMLFTGHSLPVHRSMTVPWDFNPVPYCQPSSPTPMEYATSASLEWHVWPGRRSIYNSILLLPSLPGPFGYGVVAPDRVLFMNQIELFDI